MARIAWLCPDRRCNPHGMDGTPQTYTASIGEAPLCQHCGINLEWRPAR